MFDLTDMALATVIGGFIALMYVNIARERSGEVILSAVFGLLMIAIFVARHI